jgi:hypothetical protein
MTNVLSRRQFVQVAGGSCSVLAIGGALPAQSPPPSAPTTKPAGMTFDKGPPLDSELARKTVGESHRNLEAVKQLLAADPELANCCWDWGGGDYETPLGASAHTGQTEIARLLLNTGARLDIFAAAMLGMLDVVKAAIEADDTTRYCLGPHGLTLMHHAAVGEEQSASVKKYLEEVYRNDKKVRNIPLSPRAAQRYVGAFAVESDPSRSFRFIQENGAVLWQVDPGNDVMLTNRGNHILEAESGARPARFEFNVRGGFGRSVIVSLDGTTVEAARLSA